MMRWTFGLILLGYVLVVVTFGWYGLAAAALHLGALLLCLPRR